MTTEGKVELIAYLSKGPFDGIDKNIHDLTPLLAHNSHDKLTDEQSTAFALGGFIKYPNLKICGDNPNRKEVVIDGKLLDRIDKLPLFSPSDNSIREVMAHAELQRYRRICWQLGAIAAGALLFDVALIIYLVRLAS